VIPLIPAEYDPLAPSNKLQTHANFRVLRDQCPVHHHRMPETTEPQQGSYMVASPTDEFWSIFSYSDVAQFLRQDEVFSSREGPGPERMAPLTPNGVLLTADNPTHALQRHIVNKAFLPRSVGKRIPLIQGVMDDLIDEFAHQGRADLMSDIAFPLTVAMITDIVGAGGDRRDDIRRWGAATMAAMGGGRAQVAASAGAATELFAYLTQLIVERRAALETGDELPDDVLSTMIQGAGENGFNDTEILMAAHQFLTAGYETTATAIGNGIYALCLHPEERSRLESDWSLLDNAIEEMLRFDGPVEGTFRTTTVPICLSGASLPAGAKVRAIYASANRDERQFPDAASFRIDRPAKELRGHMAFAAGAHHCPGSALARAEMSVAIQTLLRRLPGLELDPRRSPVRSEAFSTNGFAKIPIRWTVDEVRQRAT